MIHSGKGHGRVPPVNGAVGRCSGMQGAYWDPLTFAWEVWLGACPFNAVESSYTPLAGEGGFKECLSVGGPYAESIGELAWMDMPMLVRADAYDEKERQLQKKARVLPEVRIRQYV